MPNFTRIPGKFDYFGTDVHHPVDLVPEGKSLICVNLQPDIQLGSLNTRPAAVSLATTPAGVPVHSITRMNDSVPSSSTPFARFAGAGTSLYRGSGGSLTSVDTGFSGNPLAMVPYRPAQSPESWLYTYDSSKQQRYKTDGTKQNIGIQAPTAQPGIARAQPLYKLLTNTESAANWSNINPIGGTVSSPTATAKVPAAATAPIILYDTGSTGMACISANATDYGWMTSGSSVIIGGEQCYIEEIFPLMGATTVAAIAYDSGSTGLCTIVPSSALPGLRRNQLITLNGTINVRVLSVTAAPDNTYSLRCSTPSTVSVSQSITSPPNFRAWTSSNHTNGSALTGNAITATLTPTVSGGSMSAIMFGFPATYPSNLDATQISGRPIGNEDYMHVGLSFDHPEWVTEVHIMLDIDLSGAAFTNNFYYYVLEQSAFQQSAINGGTSGSPGNTPILAAQQDAVTSGVIAELVQSVLPADTNQPPYPTPAVPFFSQPSAPQSINTGQNNWTDVFFKISDMTRVGTDTTLGLAAVNNGCGILIYTNGGVVNAEVSGWYISGGYGPDCNFNAAGAQAPPIQWRYAYRNSLTGAHSTVSPEVINGETLRRQAVNLTAPASPDSQVDQIQWERRGGTNPDWHYVATVPAGTTFLDSITESAAQISDPLEVVSYQP